MRDYLKLLDEYRLNPKRGLPSNETRFAPEEVLQPQHNTKPRNRVGGVWKQPGEQTSEAPRALQQQQFFNRINDGGEIDNEVQKQTDAVRRGLPFYSNFESLLTGPPQGVLNQRWVLAITDAETFLKTWGAQAEAFGWSVENLFGLDPVAPLRRHDVMGLIWTLQGCPVIALTERTAVIKMPTGNELTFYRKNVEFPWRLRTHPAHHSK